MKRLGNKKNMIAVTILFIFLAIYSLSLISMYLWGFMTSLKTNMQYSQNMYGIPKGWPWEWEWRNYINAFTTVKVFISTGNVRRYVGVTEMLFNSLVFSLGGALINNVTIWSVAYLVSKFKKPLSRLLYTLNLALMIIPILGSLPSALMVYRFFGWYDNYSFIVFNNINFVGMHFLIYSAFFNGIGKEYTEAAYVEGASNLTIMFKIIFPITVSMFSVILLLLAIIRWNDYMTMLVWLPSYPTLAYGIYKVSVSTTTEASYPPLQITVCMLLMLPMLVLFFSFQNAIMGNLRIGALKG